MGDYVKAQELYERGEYLFAEAGEVYLRNELRAQLADVALAQRDETRARALLEEAKAYYDELGAPWQLGWLITFLARIALRHGDGFRARILLEESMKLHQQMDDRHGSHIHPASPGGGTRSENNAPSPVRPESQARCLFRRGAREVLRRGTPRLRAGISTASVRQRALSG